MTEPRRDSPLEEAVVEIDLAALRHNLAVVRERVGEATLLAMVKADAYGHGLAAVSRTLIEEGVEWLGVARLSEARALRAAGIDGARVLVLSPVDPSRLDEVRALGLVPVLSSLDAVRQWVDAARPGAGGEVEVHLKVDTGLHRLGLAPEEVGVAARALEGSGLVLGGLLSHLQESERLDSEVTARQNRLFERALEELPWDRRSSKPGGAVRRHLANSAAALYWEPTRHDLVRVGGALYGLDLALPSIETSRGATPAPLRPVMRVRAPILQVRDVAVGEGVGYNARWRAERPSRVATVGVGYGDGYPPGLRGAPVLWRGQRVRVIGAVSMDLVTVDVTGCDARPGDAVVLLGEQGEERISAHELAARLDEPAYAMPCRFALRLRRQYEQGDQSER